ncbi:MAG: hypothetical protein IT535_11745 [Bauldia sp.]|nr:hypothetical protein [Bauldia sp.]
MRHAASLIALLALAGCQTTADLAGQPADTGHLAHEFTNVRYGPTDDFPETNRFTFIEVFRELRGVGVRLTGSELCWAPNDCVRGDYAIDIPPNGTFSAESSLLVENAATENYTETFEGVDYAGNPVVLRVLFRPLEHM